MESNDAVHVVLAVYDPKGVYSSYAGVVMTSIFEHTKSAILVHILHDDTLTEENRSLFNETAAAFGQKTEFHDVLPFMDRIGDDVVELTKDWSLGALFRLFIPDILSLEKVIYLDCDIVVNMDIKELWDIPLGDRSLAGAIDYGVKERISFFSLQALRCRLIGCEWRTYINSGVLVMNLSKIRVTHSLVEESSAWFKRYGHCADFPDQDLINSCFYKDIKIIDEKFNSGLCWGDLSGRILHAIANTKPWVGMVGTDLERLYWKTYLKTPWGRSARDVIDLMVYAVRECQYLHRRTSQCYGKIFHRLRMDIFQNGVQKILQLLLKDLYHKMKRGMTGG
ncbi:MAG: glycosyltransferase family 8 protein [Synergistaceae bacterium]|nr:glycosyltransferase family 8 protein [Synergistaceae bacterium]